MRALEAFHEAEQLRLAMRQTLEAQRAVAEADEAAGMVVPASRGRRTPLSVPPSRSHSAQLEGAEGEGTDVFAMDDLATAVGAEAAPHEALILRLPDAIVLDEIIAAFLDFDTIFLVLPQLSKDWHRVVWSSAETGLWRKLCMRAWQPLHLPISKSLTASQWHSRFWRRPRLRLSGPYVTYQMFIQYPGPRTMWTPKDAPVIKVVYHYRFWWFREDSELVYIALATRSPQSIIELMRKEIVAPGTGSPGPEVVFWRGRYDITRTEGGLICDVDVPHERHGVKFRFELCPGGGAIKILQHQSYRFRTPFDIMGHPLPEQTEDRFFKYHPGFL